MEPKKTKSLYKDIYLFGRIDEGMSSDFAKELNEDTDLKSITNLNLFISSEGGIISDCLTIIDIFEYIKSRNNFTVTTFGLGMVSSGGFFLFLLGDKRILFPRCRVFVHEHVCVEELELPYSQKKRREKEEDIVHQIYTEFVAKRLGISFEKADELLKKDNWLTTEEIESYRIATEELKYGKNK